MTERTVIPESGFMIGDGQRVVCLGDSITEAADGYVTVMANLIAAAYPERGIQILNAGISGNKVTDMIARLHADVIARDPDWVTVNVGINDVWHGFFDFENGVDIPGGGGSNGVPLEVFEPTLADLVRSLLDETHARIMLITPTVIGEEPEAPANALLARYVDAMERVGAAAGVLVCPMHQAFRAALRRGKDADPTYSLTTDGVHMNAVGNYVMALAALRSLRFFEAFQPQAAQVL